jgi:diguanylate cyclase (GGDEF)-like protein
VSSEQLPGLLLSLGAALVSAFTGFALGRRAAIPLLERVTKLSDEVGRWEAQTREHSRQVARLHGDQRTQANFLRALPSAMLALNRSNLHPADIPEHLFRLADAIFEPRQILLFLARNPNQEDVGLQELHLRAQRGIEHVPPSFAKIRVGHGQIGWVAENRVEMAKEDWLNLTRTEGRTLEPEHPAFHTDLVGPLLHQGADGSQLLGVLVIGEPTTRTRDEKLMLQMITNLGAIAYVNARNVRRLREQANHDGLTGLLNKRHFMMETGQLLYVLGRDAEPMVLFMFDIDHFKRYNDSNGHLAGDNVLQGVAGMLKDNLRPQDLACRYGGEEFVVAMPYTDAPSGMQAAERIRDAIASGRFPHAESQPDGKLTISGGIAAFPGDGTNLTDLISHADRALYRAKAAGRNRIIRHESLDLGGPVDDDSDFDAAPRDIGPALNRPGA